MITKKNSLPIISSTENKRLSSLPPLIEDPTKPYTSLNKIPSLFKDYRISAMKFFREKFIEQLNIATAEEKKWCAKTGAPPMMVGEIQKTVMILVEKCKNFYEMEALARFIFDDNEIPTYDMILRRSEILKNALGFTIAQ